jgi:hypothetical protein
MRSKKSTIWTGNTFAVLLQVFLLWFTDYQENDERTDSS